MDKLTELYKLACIACDDFQAACVAQFGKSRASTMRYLPKSHNERTAVAREAFIIASKAYMDALRTERAA